MPFTLSFDGAARLITIDSVDPVNNIDVQEIYSAWKRWQVEDEGHQWVPAFLNSIGGQAITDTARVDSYYFLNNGAGWRILPPDIDGETFITGNIYAADPANPVQIPRPGVTQLLSFDRAASSQLQIVETGGVSQETLDAIYKLLANRVDTDPATGKYIVYDDDDSTVFREADLYEDIGGTTRYKGEGAERRDRLQ